MTQRRRVTISTTVDPELLDSVDAYVREHPDRDRSAVIDEALLLWLAQEQARALEDQFAEDDRPEHERAHWRRIQREAARHVLERER